MKLSKYNLNFTKSMLWGSVSIIVGSILLLSTLKSLFVIIYMVNRGKIVYQTESRTDIIEALSPNYLELTIKFSLIFIVIASLLFLGFYLIKKNITKKQ